MTRHLDNRVLVRYLMMDPPDMGRRAAELIESAADLLVTDTALAVPRSEVGSGNLCGDKAAPELE